MNNRWAKKKPVKRMTGRALQRERDRLFREQPLCVMCLSNGIVRVATQRDHIVSLAEGGLDVRDNTQALCDDCHERKSLAEAARAQGKTIKPKAGAGIDGMPTDKWHPWYT